MAKYILRWCNNINPQTESEGAITRFGAELLIDNCLRLMCISFLGFLIGRGYETFVFLAVFCGIRSQAGGIHAKTGWGCGICMFCIWSTLLFWTSIYDITFPSIVAMYFLSAVIIFIMVPQTVNRNCYTEKTIKRKKLNSFLLLSLAYLSALLISEIRDLIIGAATLEVISLLIHWSKEIIAKYQTE